MNGREAFARDVREGLAAADKAVPAKWLYDDRGSDLFEQITGLPEYYLTDRERAIFQEHAADIVSRCPPETGLVELGAGSAEKTRLLVDTLVDRQGSTLYCPIDISRQALRMAQRRFDGEDEVDVRPIEAGFVEGLRKLPSKDNPGRLIAFIGSSIGNMPIDDQIELVSEIREAMREQDRFLLGTDMRKDRQVILDAYDDGQGVTARFTKNVLRRINRELDADFDLDAFDHVVRFDEEKSAVESYLESRRDQVVRVGDLGIDVAFEEGERLHVEDSYKYTEAMVDEIIERAGLERVESWYDEDGWFGLHLLASPSAGPSSS